MEHDGPRYVAGLRDPNDPTCYKDFFEGDKLAEVQAEADSAAERQKRNTIVYDRKMHDIIYRKVVQEEAKAAQPSKPAKTFRKTKKQKKEEGRKVSNDDFF